MQRRFPTVAVNQARHVPVSADPYGRWRRNSLFLVGENERRIRHGGVSNRRSRNSENKPWRVEMVVMTSISRHGVYGSYEETNGINDEH